MVQFSSFLQYSHDIILFSRFDCFAVRLVSILIYVILLQSLKIYLTTKLLNTYFSCCGKADRRSAYQSVIVSIVLHDVESTISYIPLNKTSSSVSMTPCLLRVILLQLHSTCKSRRNYIVQQKSCNET